MHLTNYLTQRIYLNHESRQLYSPRGSRLVPRRCATVYVQSNRADKLYPDSRMAHTYIECQNQYNALQYVLLAADCFQILSTVGHIASIY